MLIMWSISQAEFFSFQGQILIFRSSVLEFDRHAAHQRHIVHHQLLKWTGDDERLIFRVADDAEAGVAAERGYFTVKFGTELCVAYVMYPPVDFAGWVGYCQTAAPGAEV